MGKLLTYEKIFSIKNLLKAEQISSFSKRHKKDVILFDLDLSFNIYSLYKELKDKSYRINKYNHFVIY